MLRGGTNASQAPQIDYPENVFLPFIRHFFGIAASLKVGKRGYFPKGGGEVTVEIHSRTSPILPVTLTERGEVKRILGTAFVAGALPAHLAYTMAKTATDTPYVGFLIDLTCELPIVLLS
jgi:RNA 3'-terminal phosphate cyclase (ATP)